MRKYINKLASLILILLFGLINFLIVGPKELKSQSYVVCPPVVIICVETEEYRVWGEKMHYRE